MEGGRQGAGQQGPQRMLAVDPVRNLPGEKTESADNHFDAFDHLEIQQINVTDADVAQIITRFGYSLFAKAKKWFNQGREGRPHATVTDWNALKEQLKQQFVLGRNKWLVGEISNGMVMKLLMNFDTESTN